MKIELKERIDDLVTQNEIVLFIKGTVKFPQCGFSGMIIAIFKEVGMPFETMNILADDALRQGMKEYSAWPAFPQVYVGGRFAGGAETIRQLYRSNELMAYVENAIRNRVHVIDIGSESKEMEQ